jgi:Protein of unknown function (DUF3592)
MKFFRIGIIALGALMMVGSLAYYGYAQVRIAHARAWPRADGHVVESWIGRETRSRSHGRRETFWVAHIAYAYAAGGRSFASQQIWLTEPVDFSRPEAAEAFMRPYSPGAPVAVFYNPANPADSALIIESRLWPIFAITGGGLLLVGLGLFSPGLRRR